MKDRTESASVYMLIALMVFLAVQFIAGAAKGADSWTESQLDRMRPDGFQGHHGALARAIDDAADKKWQRAMLLAVGRWESEFVLEVCDGHKLGDGGKAFGCWQSWEDDRSGGYSGQAKRAIDHLMKAGRYCKLGPVGSARWVRGAVSLYGTGRTCYWSGAFKRSRTFENLMRH